MMAVVDIVDTVDTQARASVTNRNQDMVSWLHDMGSHVYKCHRMGLLSTVALNLF